MLAINNNRTAAIGELIKSLWLELNHCMVQTFTARNESAAAFYAGKTAGLRLALPLLRGSDFGCRIIAAKLAFVVNADESILSARALQLKQILRQDFEALHEGGKTGLKKEWLEGHINAIGMSLALVQPCISKS